MNFTRIYAASGFYCFPIQILFHSCQMMKIWELIEHLNDIVK